MNNPIIWCAYISLVRYLCEDTNNITRHDVLNVSKYAVDGETIDITLDSVIGEVCISYLFTDHTHHKAIVDFCVDGDKILTMQMVHLDQQWQYMTESFRLDIYVSSSLVSALEYHKSHRVGYIKVHIASDIATIELDTGVYKLSPVTEVGETVSLSILAAVNSHSYEELVATNVQHIPSDDNILVVMDIESVPTIVVILSDANSVSNRMYILSAKQLKEVITDVHDNTRVVVERDENDVIQRIFPVTTQDGKLHSRGFSYDATYEEGIYKLTRM